MAQAGTGNIGIGKAVAGGAFGVRALEDAHLIGEAAFGKGQQAADPGRPVRAVRLKGAAFQRFGEGFSRLQPVPNRVRLIAIGHDQVIFKGPDRRVNNQGGILNLRGIEGLGEDLPFPLRKDPVPAVFAAAHNKIRRHRFFAVRGLAEDDSAAGIGVMLQQLLRGLNGINIHGFFSLLLLSADDFFPGRRRFPAGGSGRVPLIYGRGVSERRISAHTCSTLRGRITHSACSMTRRCSEGGVSPGRISTAFWAMISPPSGISFTKWTVAPVTFTPRERAASCTFRP